MAVAEIAERRNVPARASRDRLAGMLGLHPRQLASVTPDLADRITSHVNVLNRRLQYLVDTGSVDEMTGALRRIPGLKAIEREMSRARRFGDIRLVAAFVDLDRLKIVNDTSGHTAGDGLIKEVAGILRNRLRAYDLVIRWGGDEFVCILPETGLWAANRVLAEIAGEFQRSTGQTFSVGLAEIDLEESASELIDRADDDLYRRRRTPVPDVQLSGGSLGG